MDLDIEALGTRIRFCFSGDGVTEVDVENVARAWVRCVPPNLITPESEIFFFVDASPRRREDARNRGEQVYSDFRTCASDLVAVVTRHAIESASSRLLLIHAGAVADPKTGNVIGLIGPSGAGKTTAVSSLSTEFGYVTDETLAVSLDDMTVTAYPKPLSVTNSETPHLKDQVGPDELELRFPPEMLKLTQLFVLERDENHVGAPVLTDVPLGEAIALLVPQISFLARKEKPVHELFLALSVGGGLQRVTYRDATDLSPFLALFLARSLKNDQESKFLSLAGGPMTAETLALPVAPNPQMRPGPSGNGGIVSDEFAPLEEGARDFAVWSEPVDDAMRSDDLVVVMLAGDVVVLQGMGSDIWELGRGGIRFSDLVDRVVALHGIPAEGDAHSHVFEFVRALIAAGLIFTLPDAKNLRLLN